jgi:hypothetical protein
LLQSVPLEPEQKELLSIVVEAARNVPREERQLFYAFETLGSNLARLLHPGLPKDFPGTYLGDIKTLGQQGLLSLEYGAHGTIKFDVSPRGFKYYEELKRSQEGPVQRIEAATKDYLDAFDFRSRYTAAYEKWVEAESLLWGGDSPSALTTIGHLTRESIQLFATALIEASKPANVDPDVTHTVSRIRAALSSPSASSEAEREFLDALVAYWGSVSDLVQRQEHGAQKEGSTLIWEDARRIVFNSAVVMFEIDRAVRRTR